MATMIEYVQGQEQHTSNWGKFYIKGLETQVVREDHSRNIRDRRAQYQCYVGAEVADGTVFTIFYQDGNKRGTETWNYLICVVDGSADEQTIDYAYTETFVTGHFRVVAEGRTKTLAPRLMDWWTSRPKDVDPLAYAEHCAAHIGRRGVATLPPM